MALTSGRYFWNLRYLRGLSAKGLKEKKAIVPKINQAQVQNVKEVALTNSPRMASIIAADQATARADRQTEGIRTADRALDIARIKRGKACGPGHGKFVACRIRQAEVAKLEANQTQATATVVAQARPESSDFARLVTWVTRGAIQPGADDFTMLWSLSRTFLPQVGETMPSAPSRLAWANTVGPSSAMCSLSRMPALRSPNS
jgi:hypothetical protein